MIYFITARQLGRCKIGYSANPEQRLRQLEAGCPPAPLKLEAVCEGDQTFEAVLHQIFRPFRLHNEWFEIGPAVEMAIHFLNSGDEIPEDVGAYLQPFMEDAYPVLRKFRDHGLVLA